MSIEPVRCPECSSTVTGIRGAVNPRTAGRTYTVARCGHTVTEAFAKAAYRDGVDVAVPPVNGATLIAAERARQVDEEGHTAEHDAGHRGAELAWAAWCQIDAASTAAETAEAAEAPRMWPWAPGEWKSDMSPLARLIHAGAYIAAEVDRRLADGQRP